MRCARLWSVVLLCLAGCGDSSSAVSDSNSGSGGECTPGSVGCPCTAEGLCLTGLACVDQQCVDTGTPTSGGVPTGSDSDGVSQGSSVTQTTATDDGGATGSSTGTTDATNSDTLTSETASTDPTGAVSVSATDTASTTSTTDTASTASATDTAGESDSDSSSTGAQAICGDGVADADEACDGADLKGSTCAELGFMYGALACTPGCEHDATQCTDSAVCGDGVIVQDVLCYKPVQPVKGRLMRQIVLGDVNGDGHLDIVGSSYSIGVVVYFGNGDGTVKPNAQDVQSADLKMEATMLVDINKDGHLDLLGKLNSADKLQIAHGDGTGKFTAAVSYDVFPDLRKFAVADADADGRLDLVHCNTGGLKKVSFRRGQPGGLFGPIVSYTTDPVHSSETCGFYDVDVDGRLDLWASVGGSFQVWNGDGAGGFTLNPVKGKIIALSYTYVGDLNKDGYTDVAGYEYSFPTELNVIHGAANGYKDMVYSFAIGGSWPLAAFSGDFDGNAEVDLCVGLEAGSGLLVFRGESSGLFHDGVVLDAKKNLRAFAVGDMNEDGLDDIVTSHWLNDVQGLEQKVILSDP